MPKTGPKPNTFRFCWISSPGRLRPTPKRYQLRAGQRWPGLAIQKHRNLCGFGVFGFRWYRPLPSLTRVRGPEVQKLRNHMSFGVFVFQSVPPWPNTQVEPPVCWAKAAGIGNPNNPKPIWFRSFWNSVLLSLIDPLKVLGPEIQKTPKPHVSEFLDFQSGPPLPHTLVVPPGCGAKAVWFGNPKIIIL